jgi:hypothetical protein
MKRLLIAAAAVLLLQAACGLPAALGMPGSTPPALTEAAPASRLPANSEPGVQNDPPADGEAPASTPLPGQAPVATLDPRLTFLLAQLRAYLATNPHIQKVDRLELKGSLLDLEITTAYPGQTDQAGVAYETVTAIAGGLSLAPKEQVEALINSGRGALHMRVNSSDAAFHFESDTPVAVMAGLQAGQVSLEAWMAASHYKQTP